MTRMARGRGSATIAALLMTVSTGIARGDINSFTNFANDWMTNYGDGAAGVTYTQATDTVHLTYNAGQERRTTFYKTQQSIGDFEAGFTYRAENITSGGVFFVIQKASDGPGALGQLFGYTGISPSVALTLELAGNGGAINESGVYRNGNYGGGSLSVDPVNLLSGHRISVSLVYHNGSLDSTLTDLQTQQQYVSPSFPVNIPAILGSSTGYVGFTGGYNGTFGTSDQYLSQPYFHSVPEPATIGLLAFATAICRRCFRKR